MGISNNLISTFLPPTHPPPKTSETHENIRKRAEMSENVQNHGRRATVQKRPTRFKWAWGHAAPILKGVRGRDAAAPRPRPPPPATRHRSHVRTLKHWKLRSNHRETTCTLAAFENSQSSMRTSETSKTCQKPLKC